MKKKLLSILLLIIFFVTFSIPAGTKAAAGMKLNKTKVVLEVDSKITLKLGEVKAADVKWSSSAKKVAAVSGKGVVTAKAEGSATITATYNNKKYKCKVTVVDSNKKMFSDVQEYLDAQQDEFDEIIESLDGLGMSMKVFADDNILVYEYIYESEILAIKEAKKHFDKYMTSQEETLLSLIEEMEEYIDVENPKVKFIYKNPDGTIVYEYTFPEK